MIQVIRLRSVDRLSSLQTHQPYWYLTIEATPPQWLHCLGLHGYSFSCSLPFAGSACWAVDAYVVSKQERDSGISRPFTFAVRRAQSASYAPEPRIYLVEVKQSCVSVGRWGVYESLSRRSWVDLIRVMSSRVKSNWGTRTLSSSSTFSLFLLSKLP
jgi:hypothetical protein